MKDFRIVFRSVWHNPGNRGRRLRKAWQALEWQIFKRVVRRPRTLRLRTGALFRAYPDCVVSSALVYADWPEYHELMFIRGRLQRDEAIIDVGANVGHILLLLSDLVPSDRLYGFEPTPVSFMRLRENWQLNHWPVTQLYSVALGATEGTLFMRNASTPDTTNALHETRGDEDLAVAIKPLDCFRELWRNHAIGLLKIDVEGFEPSVFQGSTNLLRSERPKLIMFESLGGQLSAETGKVFVETGYRAFQLDGDGKPDFSRLTAQNLFAIPAERVVELEAGR